MNTIMSQFESSANTILQAIETNQEFKREGKEDKVLLEMEEMQMQNENPEIPKPRHKIVSKPKKKRGFFGFLLGAISIVVGAAFTLCSGGLLANFGIGMIVNGLNLIKTNIEMNRNGTYDGSSLLKQFVVSSVTSFVTSFGSSVLQDLPGKIAKASKRITSLFTDPEKLKNVVEQTVSQRMANSALETADIVLANTSEEQPLDSEGASEEQKQEFVNDQLQQWYDSSIKPEVEKISPEKIEEFLEKLQPSVQALLSQLSLPEDKFLRLALILKNWPNLRAHLESILTSHSSTFQKKFKATKRVAEVLDFQNFGIFSGMEISDPLKEAFKGLEEELDNLQKQLPINFSRPFFEFLQRKTKEHQEIINRGAITLAEERQKRQEIEAACHVFNPESFKKEKMKEISEKVLVRVMERRQPFFDSSCIVEVLLETERPIVPFLQEFFSSQIFGEYLQSGREGALNLNNSLFEIMKIPVENLLLSML